MHTSTSGGSRPQVMLLMSLADLQTRLPLTMAMSSRKRPRDEPSLMTLADVQGHKRARGDDSVSSSSSFAAAPVETKATGTVGVPAPTFQPTSLEALGLSDHDPAHLVDPDLARDLGIHCQICLALPKDPQEISTCKHVYCLDCIVRYIRNLGSETGPQLPTGNFSVSSTDQSPCPICKQVFQPWQMTRCKVRWTFSAKHVSLAADQ